MSSQCFWFWSYWSQTGEKNYLHLLTKIIFLLPSSLCIFFATQKCWEPLKSWRLRSHRGSEITHKAWGWPFWATIVIIKTCKYSGDLHLTLWKYLTLFRVNNIPRKAECANRTSLLFTLISSAFLLFSVNTTVAVEKKYLNDRPLWWRSGGENSLRASLIWAVKGRKAKQK